MSMTLSEAIGWATTCLETRAEHWRNAAEGVWPDNAELYDADTDERNNMADMYEEAQGILDAVMGQIGTFGNATIHVNAQGNIRLIKTVEMHTYPSGLQVPLSIYEANKKFEEDNKQRP
jgi:hypothetical protein